MKSLLSRVRQLNRSPLGPGPIVYWMNRDQRTEDNWALIFAASLAAQHGRALIVAHNLKPNFLGSTLRQWDFKVRGLQMVEQELKEKNIPFAVFIDESSTASAESHMISAFKSWNIGALVSDFSPLRIAKAWRSTVLKSLSCTYFEVDAHNIVPCWIASQKAEFAARTIRPKITKLLPSFLTEFPHLPKLSHQTNLPKIPAIHWTKLLSQESIAKLGIDQTVPQTQFQPGHTAATSVLKKFLNTKLNKYADGRNDPNQDAQSDLSPYLHYGHISAQHIALVVQKHGGAGSTEFLEELIIRRELADNFCEFQPNYDSSKCFPDWAQKTLLQHLKDKREYTYNRTQFEHAKTHDELWNAAQNQMRTTGKMHGYLRMYWAKKILEWTENPDQAMKIAIYLNDKYSLDGRDPNGYAGIAWSIGGVHDRAWFPHPVFGTIRYMNASGASKKFNVPEYVAKWSKNQG